jgi:hypothetical protein
MEPIADLPALETLLEGLAPRDLVVFLSPPGQKRGVVVTHGLYPPAELEKVRQAFAQSAAAGEYDERPARIASVRAEAASVGPPAWAAEFATLRTEVESLRGKVASLEAELRELKSALGV